MGLLWHIGSSCAPPSHATKRNHKTANRIAVRIVFVHGLVQHLHRKSVFRSQPFHITGAMRVATAPGKLVAWSDGKIRTLVGKERENKQAFVAQAQGRGLKDSLQVAEMDQGCRSHAGG